MIVLVKFEDLIERHLFTAAFIMADVRVEAALIKVFVVIKVSVLLLPSI